MVQRCRVRFCQFVTSCCVNFFGVFVTKTTSSKIRCTRGLANILSFCTKKRLAVNVDEKDIVELTRSFVDLVDDEQNDVAAWNGSTNSWEQHGDGGRSRGLKRKSDKDEGMNS